MATTTLFAPWGYSEFDSGVATVAPILRTGTVVDNTLVAAVQAAAILSFSHMLDTTAGGVGPTPVPVTGLPATASQDGKNLQVAPGGSGVVWAQQVAGTWTTGTAYLAGQALLNPSGNPVTVKTSHTAGTYATDVTAGRIDDPHGAYDALGSALQAPLFEAFGATSAVPNQPWKPSPVVGPNLWTLANLSSNASGSSHGTPQTATVSPSLVGTNSGNQDMLTRIALPDPAVGNNGAQRYRLTFTLDGSTITGTPNNLALTVSPRDSGGNLLSTFATEMFPYYYTSVIPLGLRSVLEFDVISASEGVTTASYLDVGLHMFNTTGALSLSAVTLYRVEEVHELMWISYRPPTGIGGVVATISQPCGKNASGAVIECLQTMGPDSALELGLIGATFQDRNGYQDAWSNGFSKQPPNPLENYFGTFLSSPFRVNNDGQIIGVYDTSGSTELRGNNHGGEVGVSGTYATDYQVFADYQDGNGWTALTANEGGALSYCYRVKVVAATKITRSDQGSPFALVTSTYVFYADGTIRKDQTTTFQQAQQLSQWILHMSSFMDNVGLNPALGKIGRGSTVLNSVDYTAKLAPPVISGMTTATTGGHLPAGHYSVVVTAYTPSGETPVNNIFATVSSIIPAGTATNTLVPTWGAVTGATGYGIYFGAPGKENRIATVAAGTLTYTILGNEVPTNVRAPQENNAYTGTTTSAMAESGQAAWGVYKDLTTGAVYGMCVDRDECLALNDVEGVRVAIQRQDGSLCKEYFHLDFAGADLPFTVPSGAVYSNTCWWFHTMPADPTHFEREIAALATAPAALKTIYPVA